MLSTSFTASISYLFSLDPLTLNVIDHKLSDVVYLGKIFNPSYDAKKLIFWDEGFNRIEVPNFMGDSDNLIFKSFEFT